MNDLGDYFLGKPRNPLTPPAIYIETACAIVVLLLVPLLKRIENGRDILDAIGCGAIVQGGSY